MPPLNLTASPDNSIWHSVYTWSSFKLDALGLITLLGAEEVDIAIGQLTRSTWCEFLPIMASNIVAADKFRKPIPGYGWYQITDGFTSKYVSSWFARWLQAQHLASNSSVIHVRETTKAEKEQYDQHHCLGLLIGFVLCGGIFVTAIVSYRATGLLAMHLINVFFLLLTIASRVHNLRVVRRALDRVVRKECEKRDKPEHSKNTECKVWLTLPSAQYCTVRGPRKLMNVLLTEPELTLKEQKHYSWSRVVCWAAFAGHAVTLGSTSLTYQIICVVIMIVSTFAFIARPLHDVGEHNGKWALCFASLLSRSLENSLRIGNELRFLIADPADVDGMSGHSAAYARLDLSAPEEKMMMNWGLMFDESAVGWWVNYYQRKQNLQHIASSNRSTQRPLLAQMEQLTSVPKHDEQRERQEVSNSQSVISSRLELAPPLDAMSRSCDEVAQSPRRRWPQQDDTTYSKIWPRHD